MHLPFLAPDVLEVRDHVLPLHRRVVPLACPGLFLVGFIQTVGSNVPLLGEVHARRPTDA